MTSRSRQAAYSIQYGLLLRAEHFLRWKFSLSKSYHSFFWFYADGYILCFQVNGTLVSGLPELYCYLFFGQSDSSLELVTNQVYRLPPRSGFAYCVGLFLNPASMTYNSQLLLRTSKNILACTSLIFFVSCNMQAVCILFRQRPVATRKL